MWKHHAAAGDYFVVSRKAQRASPVARESVLALRRTPPAGQQIGLYS